MNSRTAHHLSRNECKKIRKGRGNSRIRASLQRFLQKIAQRSKSREGRKSQLHKTSTRVKSQQQVEVGAGSETSQRKRMRQSS